MKENLFYFAFNKAADLLKYQTEFIYLISIEFYKKEFDNNELSDIIL